MNITPESALRLGMSVKEACCIAWMMKAAADVLDYPKAVAMGAEEMADWLKEGYDDAATQST